MGILKDEFSSDVDAGIIAEKRKRRIARFACMKHLIGSTFLKHLTGLSQTCQEIPRLVRYFLDL
jgi:hypothetical protein